MISASTDNSKQILHRKRLLVYSVTTVVIVTFAVVLGFLYSNPTATSLLPTHISSVDPSSGIELSLAVNSSTIQYDRSVLVSIDLNNTQN